MNKIKNSLTVIIIFTLGLVVYWTTSYPSITWWETSEYSAAAVCLGLTGAPGSIIMTFFGWVLSKLATHNPAFIFNLFAGLIASLTVVFSFLTFKKILHVIKNERQNNFSFIESLSLIITSGIIICSATLWEYAIMFTPYILTALFTVLILLSVLNWWIKAHDTDSWKKLFIITLLLGIDFSVHRTNAVLVPGILIIILIRNPRIFLSYKSYLAAIGGIILGFSIQLLYIPMSLNDPSLNLGETNSFSMWWNFISLKQYGGNFLMEIFVRKGPFWTYQVPYYFSGFANNFLYFNHNTVILGFFPALLGLIGIIYLFKTYRRIAIALVSFFVITIAVSIIYFNLPANYFRAIYRHYMPTYIIFSVFIFLGAFFIINRLLKSSGNKKFVFISIIILLLSGTSLTQLFANLKYRNGSKRTFTVDHAGNIINSIESDGIVFSYGDNDYFPELYLQIGEKLRPDIVHCNLTLLNLDWYIRQKQRQDKNFPFRGDGIDVSKIEYKDWETKNLSIQIVGSVRKKYSTDLDTFCLSLPALRQNNYNLLEDLVLFDIIRNNQWKRPVYFVKQNLENEIYNWLKPYLRDEGLVYKFIPDSSNKVDVLTIEANLKKFKFPGYNDSSITLDDVSKKNGKQYYDMFLNVLKNKTESGDWKGAARYLKEMKEILPFNRLQPDPVVINESKETEELIKKNLY
jgi:hypothetical protein